MIEDFLTGFDMSDNIAPSINETFEIDDNLDFDESYLTNNPDFQDYGTSISISDSLCSDGFHFDFDNDITLSDSTHESVDSYDSFSEIRNPSDMHQELMDVPDTDEMINTPTIDCIEPSDDVSLQHDTSVDYQNPALLDSLHIDDPVSFGGNMYDERAEKFIRDVKNKGIDLSSQITGSAASGGIKYVDKYGIYQKLKEAFEQKKITEKEYNEFKNRVVGL
jgi:hypothetical protein